MPMNTTETLTEDEAQEYSWLSERYQIINKVGTGTFSTVYKAVNLRNKELEFVALKCITRTSSPKRIADELECLRTLNGKNNVIPLLNCHRQDDSVIAVFPHYEYINFKEFVQNRTLLQIKQYMHSLLEALNHVHDNNYIHRDIKPSNFLFDPIKRKGVLIDFGLAQKYVEEKDKIIENELTNKHSVVYFNYMVSKTTKPPGYIVNDSRPPMKAPRAGTRGFRAPEVLLRYKYQTSKIDIWSVGVIFLILLTKEYPFFYSLDDIDALVELGCIFGHTEMRRAAKHYGRIWRSNISTIPEERVSFETIVSSINEHEHFESEVFDLLYKLMDLNANNRITAKKAMEHPFFNELNEK